MHFCDELISGYLGNLLDNALNAMERVDEKWVNITIRFVKGTLLIKIANSYDGTIKFIDGEEENIVSTKKGDEHGYGLANIRRVIDKYNGELRITTKDHVFSVSVFMIESNFLVRT